MGTDIVDILVAKHRTRDPFELAAAMGRIIVIVPLIDVRGFYQYIKRSHIIYLSDKLDDPERSLVCAHELGHSILHTKTNAVFLDSRTHFVTAKYEDEADRFAMGLVFSDDKFYEYLYMPISDIARALGVTDKMVTCRLQMVQLGMRNAESMTP